MKYTIELTNKQKAQMDCIIEIVHRYVGFNPKLEPIKTTNVEDTNEYQIGYKEGYADGKADAIHNASLIDELKQVEYNKALKDVNRAMDVLKSMTGTECAEWFNGYVGVDEVVCGFNIERILEGTKAYEESIKVGDEVENQYGSKAVVTRVKDNCVRVMFKDGSGFRLKHTIDEFKKTGRHFDEVEQLLDKLGREGK